MTLDFPEVRFSDPGAECERSITYFGRPAGAFVWLDLDGSYDGHSFSVGGLTPAAGTSPIDIVQRHFFQAKDDEVCVNVDGYPAEYPFPNYYSVLMHGFFDSPPITVQEMPDRGTRSDDPLGETISGWDKGSNDYPIPNYGRHPFTSGLITWTFIQYRKLLPLGP